MLQCLISVLGCLKKLFLFLHHKIRSINYWLDSDKQHNNKVEFRWEENTSTYLTKIATHNIDTYFYFIHAHY